MSAGPVRLELLLPADEGDAPPAFAQVDVTAPTQLPPAVTMSDGSLLTLHRDVVAENGGLLGCVGCGHPELFTQKDFSRAFGLSVVVVAALLAPFTYYISLALAALIDALLYRFAPDVVRCYVCGSGYRGFPDTPKHPRFDLEIAERLRYGKRAVMGKPMRPGGTANAPEPEH